MKEKGQRLPRRLFASVWFQAGLVFLLALSLRLIALSRPIHHNELFYALASRDLLLDLTEPGGEPLTGMGSFRAVTLNWGSAILLYLRYWLHLAHIWPVSLPDGITLQQFAAFEATHPLDVLNTMRLSTVLISALGTGLVFVLSRQLWGLGSAVLVTAFVSLDPFFLGFSRILNTDGHVATWTVVALLAFLAYLDQGKFRLAGLTVLSTGLALLSKPSAILLVGFLPVAAMEYGLVIGSTHREHARRVVQGVLAIGGVVILWQIVAWLTGSGQSFFSVLWLTVRNYITYPGELKFSLGKTAYAPPWTFYPAALVARTTPSVVAGTLLGTIALIKAKSRGPEWRIEVARWTILASFVVLFIIFITLPNIKIDRYLLPVFPVLAVMGARGLVLLYQWAKGCCPQPILKAGIAALVFAQLVGVLVTFPYYTTYYSPILGHKVLGITQVGYGEGLDLIAEHLNEKPDAESLNVLSFYSREVLGPRFRGTTWQMQTVYGDMVATSQTLDLPSFLTADYVITYVSQIQRKLPDPRLIAYYQNRRPEMEVYLAGLLYAALYPGPIYGGSVSEGAALLEYPSAAPLRLLGYHLENSESIEGYALTLFWQAETPLAQDYTVAAKLVSADGQVWGGSAGWPVEGLLPTSLWEPGKIVRDDHLLRPLSGTPPGTYFLEVTIADSNTGQSIPLTSGEIGPGGGLVLQTVTLEHPARPSVDEGSASNLGMPQQRNVARGVRLLGYSAISRQDMRPGESLPLVLLWQATRSAPPAMSLQWQLTRNGSSSVELGNTSPGTDRYPLSAWQKHEMVRDQFTMRLPANLEGGHYELRALLPDGTALEMGTVQVTARQHIFDVPQVAEPLDIAFGDVARLSGYDLDLGQVDVGGPIRLTLYWQAQREMETAYKVFVHFLDDSGQILAQVDQEPQAGEVPTTSWLTGEVVVDEIEIPMTQEMAATQAIAVGLYDPLTGERTLVLDNAGTVIGDHATLSVR